MKVSTPGRVLTVNVGYTQTFRKCPCHREDCKFYSKSMIPRWVNPLQDLHLIDSSLKKSQYSMCFEKTTPSPPKKTRHLQAFSRHLAQFLLISFRATLRLFGSRLHWCCFWPVEADIDNHHRKVTMEKNNMTGWWFPTHLKNISQNGFIFPK